MTSTSGFGKWASILGAALLLAARGTPASVTMEGEVTLDYYVADIDPEGFEYAATDFFVEQIVNGGDQRSGPLSLAGWLTDDPGVAGAGSEIGYVPLGTLAGHSSMLDVLETADADDATPGEYYVHLLLQDDAAPGTFEDARSLSPRLLWRGGLEAVGPLHVTSDSSGRLHVDFDELRNNRLDGRFTNSIDLTLYATYGFSPASDGYTVCRVTVPGLGAGDRRLAPGFDCWPGAIPDGDYTLHVEVAEVGGRGGYSTLTGPDAYFRGGHLDDGTTVDVHAGAVSWALLLALALPLLARGAAQVRRRSAWFTIVRISAG